VHPSGSPWRRNRSALRRLLAQHLRPRRRPSDFRKRTLIASISRRIVPACEFGRGRSSRSPCLRAGPDLLAGAGLGDRAFEDLADRGPLRAAETESRPAITSAAIRPCRLPVRRARQGSTGRSRSPYLDRVADGEDVGVARAHVLVDPDPPRWRSRSRPSSPARSPDARRSRGSRCPRDVPCPNSRGLPANVRVCRIRPRRH